MTLQLSEGWEKEFDYKFHYLFQEKRSWSEEIKSFIRSLLADHDREIVKKIRKLKSEYGGYHEGKIISDAIEAIKGGR